MATADTNGVKLYYEVHGSGEPVLFLHGFPLSGRMWQAIVQPMRDAFTLIIPDLRGLGRSPATEGVSMATYVDDLVGLVRVIGETRPITLVGLSMGGYIAFEFVRRHADRLRTLVLTDTRAENDTPEVKQNRIDTAERVRKDGSRVVADAMIDKLFGPQAPTDLRTRWRDLMADTDPDGVIAALTAMRDRPDSRPLLAEIRVPTLVVVGADDAITPPNTARVMHQGIPGSQLEIIPGAGHMVPLEQPQRFVDVLTRFLKG